jgi:peptidyl-prolyl cis-trans isomerase D
MLTQLREKSQSFLIFILFGMLIVVFIFFFGPQAEGIRPGGGPTTSLSGWAVDVDGEEISQREVEMSVRRQAFYGQDINNDELPKVRRETAHQVAGRALIANRAAQMGLALGDEELSAYITSDKNPDFGLFTNRAGKFDKTKYQNQIGQSLGGNLPLYRKAKERELIVQRYLRFLTAQVKVSKSEVREAYDRTTRSWNLEYLPLDPADYAQAVPDPSAQAGAAYAKANAKAVEDYYKAHKAEYDRDKEIEVRRVLIKLEQGSTEGQKAAARKKADEAHAKAKAAGADFSAIAKESSEGYYKAFGGKMGWQTKERTSPTDFKVYDALAKGAVSDVQESAIGFWFVKADDVRPAVKKSLDAVRDEIGGILAKRNGRMAVARKAGEAMLLRLKAGEELAAVVPAPEVPAPAPVPTPEEGAEPVEVVEAVEAAPATSEPPPSPVKTTGPIKDARPVFDRIPGIGKSARLATLLPTLTKEKPLVQELIEVDDTLYLVKLKERVEPDDKGFEEARDDFSTRLRLQRATAIFGNWEQILFGPARQRELFSRFGGGALVAQLTNLPDSVKMNEEAYPTPAPAEAAKPPVPVKP